MEEYEHAVRRGAKIYCEVAGWGVSSDAFHITAPQPEGEGQMAALRRAMVNGNVKPEDVKAKYEDGVLSVIVPKEDVKKFASSTAIAIE